MTLLTGAKCGAPVAWDIAIRQARARVQWCARDQGIHAEISTPPAFVLIVARLRDYAAFAEQSFEECHCLPR